MDTINIAIKNKGNITKVSGAPQGSCNTLPKKGSWVTKLSLDEISGIRFFLLQAADHHCSETVVKGLRKACEDLMKYQMERIVQDLKVR